MMSSQESWWLYWVQNDITSLQGLLDRNLLNVNQMLISINEKNHVIVDDVMAQTGCRHKMVYFLLMNGLSLKLLRKSDVDLPLLVFLKAPVDTVKVFVEFLYAKHMSVFEMCTGALSIAALRADTSSVFLYLLANLHPSDLAKLVNQEKQLARQIILMAFESPWQGRKKDWLSYHDCIQRLKGWLAAQSTPDFQGLYFICSKVNYDYYRIFIDVFVEAGIPIDEGLRAAVLSKKWDIVIDLIRRGADVNIQLHNPSGNSILIEAIIHDAPIDVISALLLAGADVSLMNTQGKTAIDIVQCGLIDRPVSNLVLNFVGGRSTKEAADQ